MWLRLYSWLIQNGARCTRAVTLGVTPEEEWFVRHQMLPDPVFSQEPQKGLLLLPEKQPHSASGRRRMICWLPVTEGSTQLDAPH
jgi:hypothetical protein